MQPGFEIPISTMQLSLCVNKLKPSHSYKSYSSYNIVLQKLILTEFFPSYICIYFNHFLHAKLIVLALLL